MKSKCLILVAEDTPADAKMLQLYIDQYQEFIGETVVLPKLSMVLLELATRKFDIILLDLNLLDSKGSDTFFKIRAAFPNIPIIIITGVRPDNTDVKLCKFKADGFISKDHIMGAVPNHIASTRLGDEIQFAIIARNEINRLEELERVKTEGVSDVRACLKEGTCVEG